MILKSLRFLEYLFGEISFWFELQADRFDNELQAEIKKAILSIPCQWEKGITVPSAWATDIKQADGTTTISGGDDYFICE